MCSLCKPTSLNVALPYTLSETLQQKNKPYTLIVGSKTFKALTPLQLHGSLADDRSSATTAAACIAALPSTPSTTCVLVYLKRTALVWLEGLEQHSRSAAVYSSGTNYALFKSCRKTSLNLPNRFLFLRATFPGNVKVVNSRNTDLQNDMQIVKYQLSFE